MSIEGSVNLNLKGTPTSEKTIIPSWRRHDEDMTVPISLPKPNAIISAPPRSPVVVGLVMLIAGLQASVRNPQGNPLTSP